MCRSTFRFQKLLPELEKAGIVLKSSRSSRSEITAYKGEMHGVEIHGLLNIKDHILSIYNDNAQPTVLKF